MYSHTGPSSIKQQGEERAVGATQQPLPSPIHLPAFHSNTPIPNLLPSPPLQNLLPSPFVPHLLSSSTATPSAEHSTRPRSTAATSITTNSSCCCSSSSSTPGAFQDQREPRGRGHNRPAAAQRHLAAAQRGRRHREPASHPAAVPSSPPPVAPPLSPPPLTRRPRPG